MNAKLCTSLSSLAVTAALLAGCGSSNSSSTTTTTSSAAAASTAAATTSAPGTASTVPAAPTGTTPTTPSAEAAVAACEAAFNSSPLSASLKTKLLGICKEAVSGPAGAAAAKQQGAQVCAQLVKTLPTAEQAIMQTICAKI
jgi:hypothetical protein